ncbi:MAG: ribosome small subunit-dependent GTPase A [Acidobacteria bacterium]|nr:ribosome small subunit-dependent GTPase A [Acidobacteriota bacterium]MBI3656823.1 ribosome small subunit-dependent GTPase A [Acidobacteriota bacterium]
MKLETFGWNSYFASHFKQHAEAGFSVGRVVLEHKNFYRVYTEHGELWAELSGKLHYLATSRQDLPAVGDWVVIQILGNEDKATLHHILPRKSRFSRKVAGSPTEEQIVASNIETVFLMSGLDADFNLRRIERYVIMARASGANPVIVLNKSDLCAEVAQRITEVESVAHNIPIRVISATQGSGLNTLQSFLSPGETVALLGSSGVGKSTLTNVLAGQPLQQVREVRYTDGRGKHATTHRQLILLPSGALIVDTPGLRELQLWVGEEGFKSAFADIAALAEGCLFRDCRHREEPTCAVKEAVKMGTLEASRFENYKKMEKELELLATLQVHKAARLQKGKWKNGRHPSNQGRKRR